MSVEIPVWTSNDELILKALGAGNQPKANTFYDAWIRDADYHEPTMANRHRGYPVRLKRQV